MADFSSDSHYLIVGLGNPGEKYERTRHNLGFRVLRAFAHEQGWSFKRSLRMHSEISQGVLSGKLESGREQTVHLLLPMTYMNLSGRSVRKAADYFKVGLKGLLVVVDDVYLPVGGMRLRESGTPGGHNGLKSIDEMLGTQDYARLRVGVGPKKGENILMPLEDYVLGAFTAEEEQKLPEVIDRGVAVIDCWLKGGFKPAQQLTSEKN